MVQPARHPVGTFCYVESGSVAVAASQGFYASLLDWEVDESAFPDGGSYTRFLMRELPVAGAFSVDAQQDLSMLPAQWWPFVSVESVENTLALAVSLGAVPFGNVVDVPGEFSAAEFRDPSGALCGLWQPGTHIGANLVSEIGALAWTDLSTPDLTAAASFYCELFGWELGTADEQENYEFFTSEGTVVAGLTRSESADHSSWWRPHVGVGDFDASAAVATDLGGNVGVDAPYVSGLGRRAAVQDPNGISLMLIELKS